MFANAPTRAARLDMIGRHTSKDNIMILTRTSILALTALTFTFAPAVWAANNITAIAPDANQVVLRDGGATVRFRVSGQGNNEDRCGVWISYGDQAAPDTQTMGRTNGLFSGEVAHTFTRPGEYTITARGEPVNQAGACGGVAVTKVSVAWEQRGQRRDDRRDDRRAAEVGCPNGWQMREGSFNRESGAFTCTPSYPAQRMECGRGLRYFEGDNVIGCQLMGSNRR
jgi:hypothetical protein